MADHDLDVPTPQSLEAARKMQAALNEHLAVPHHVLQRVKLSLAIDQVLTAELSLSEAAKLANLSSPELALALQSRGISTHRYREKSSAGIDTDSMPDSLKLSVVMPCYNEKNTLKTILNQVRAVDIHKEIIIVDDCSRDGTRDLLKNEIEGLYEDVKVVYHEKNQGKGSALRTGFQHATGNVILIQDADLEYNPQEYYRLLQPILEGQADVVYGSRFAGGSHRVHLYWHAVGNKFLTSLSNMFTNLNLTDMETCYKVFRTEVLQGIQIQQNRFGFEPEITAKIAKKHVRVYEVPISYHGRDYSEGKKIGWKDGFQALWCIVKYRLTD